MLEHYFDMNRENARRSLIIYKSFVKETGDMQELIRTARILPHIDLDFPELTPAPTSLLAAMEEYLDLGADAGGHGGGHGDDDGEIQNLEDFLAEDTQTNASAPRPPSPYGHRSGLPLLWVGRRGEEVGKGGGVGFCRV